MTPADATLLLLYLAPTVVVLLAVFAYLWLTHRDTPGRVLPPAPSNVRRIGEWRDV